MPRNLIEVDTSNVMAAFKARTRGGTKSMRVMVGFSAPYAVYVHENLQANHPVGQAKFLETPAKRFGRRMRDYVANSLKSRHGLAMGLWRAGNALLKEAQALCPVDTGFLRASGYVRVKHG